MGSAPQTKVYGTIRYSLPDLSVSADERSLYSFPAPKQTQDILHELHDIRTSPDIVRGTAGLDVQGFTYVQHESQLSGEEWFEPGKVEEVYVREMCELICQVTGAKRAVVDGMAFRRKLPAAYSEDPKHMTKRGGEFDQALAKLPRDVMRAPGRELATSHEPARIAHVDYTIQGLRDTARYARHDIKAVAQPTLDAEDAGESPRYAVYSIWRPLQPVHRDPLAVLDFRTFQPPTDLHAFQSRVLSGINPSGEYLRTSAVLAPPTQDPEKQKWYWVPEQRPDEVLVIKFADTEAEEGKDGVAGTGVHGAAVIEGREAREARESVECRILAFW